MGCILRAPPPQSPACSHCLPPTRNQRANLILLWPTEQQGGDPVQSRPGSINPVQYRKLAHALSELKQTKTHATINHLLPPGVLILSLSIKPQLAFPPAAV